MLVFSSGEGGRGWQGFRRSWAVQRVETRYKHLVVLLFLFLRFQNTFQSGLPKSTWQPRLSWAPTTRICGIGRWGCQAVCCNGALLPSSRPWEAELMAPEVQVAELSWHCSAHRYAHYVHCCTAFWCHCRLDGLGGFFLYLPPPSNADCSE